MVHSSVFSLAFGEVTPHGAAESGEQRKADHEQEEVNAEVDENGMVTGFYSLGFHLLKWVQKS